MIDLVAGFRPCLTSSPRPVPAGETFVSMRIGDYQKQSRYMASHGFTHLLFPYVSFVAYMKR